MADDKSELDEQIIDLEREGICETGQDGEDEKKFGLQLVCSNKS